MKNRQLDLVLYFLETLGTFCAQIWYWKKSFKVLYKRKESFVQAQNRHFSVSTLVQKFYSRLIHCKTKIQTYEITPMGRKIEHVNTCLASKTTW